MKIIVKEIYQDWRTKAEKVMETNTVEAESLEKAFEKAYPYERSLRYCSDHFIRIFDEAGNSLMDKWQEWKKTGLSISLYYGNATVD